MKKIIAMVAMVAALFTLSSCGTALHNGTSVNIVGVKLINVPVAREGQTVWVVESWMPGNVWGAGSPNSAVVSGKAATINFSSAASVTTSPVNTQVIHSFWDDKLEAGVTFDNPYDGGTYYVVVDCTAHTATLQ